MVRAQAAAMVRLIRSNRFILGFVGFRGAAAIRALLFYPGSRAETATFSGCPRIQVHGIRKMVLDYKRM